jgi:hypothetical protein
VFAIWKYDVFIFGFGQSLFPRNYDLPVLRFLRKKVICNLSHGSDARPRYMNGPFYVDGAFRRIPDGSKILDSREPYDIVKRTASRVNFIERYSTFVIGAPFSTSQFARKPFINIFSIGIPLHYPSPPFSTASHFQEQTANCFVKILHSPSHPVAKGTACIQQAIDNLRAKGHDIDFVMIHGRTNTEVIQAIQACDFIVDQVYSDGPMAGFAAEAAWFGKPAVVGGYGLDGLKSWVPAGMWPPTKICHPDRLEVAIEEMIVDRQQRETLGAQAKEFIHNVWKSESVVHRFIRLIHDDIPSDWWLDPTLISYLHGCGVSESACKESICRLVECYGKKALCVSHRPDLEQALIKFSGLQEKNAACLP